MKSWPSSFIIQHQHQHQLHSASASSSSASSSSQNCVSCSGFDKHPLSRKGPSGGHCLVAGNFCQIIRNNSERNPSPSKSNTPPRPNYRLLPTDHCPSLHLHDSLLDNNHHHHHSFHHFHIGDNLHIWKKYSCVHCANQPLSLPSPYIPERIFRVEKCQGSWDIAACLLYF